MSRMEYTTSTLPIVTVADEASGDNKGKDVIAYEVQRTLGGKGTLTVTFTDVYGFNNGSIQWKEVTSLPSYLALPASTVPYTFVHIKNPGYRYTSATVLGEVSAAKIRIILQYDTEVIQFGELDAGESIVLPLSSSIDQETNFIGYKAVPTYIDSGAYTDTVTSTLSYGAYLDTVIGIAASEAFTLSTAMEILAVN